MIGLLSGLTSCHKASGPDSSTSGGGALLVSIPGIGTRDGVDTAVALPESSLRDAISKASEMIRIANSAAELERRESDLDILIAEASRKLDGWAEPAVGASSETFPSLMKAQSRSYLALLKNSAYLADEQLRIVSAIASKRDSVSKDLRSYERTHGAISFRSATVDSLSDEMATATWWVLDQLIRQFAEVHRGGQQVNVTGFSIEGIATGKPVTDSQVLFELDPTTGHFVIARSMSGANFFDYVAPGKSDLLKMEPGVGPVFRTMFDRVVATMSSTSDLAGHGTEDGLEQAIVKQTGAYRDSVAKARSFIRLGEDVEAAGRKAARLTDEVKSSEEAVRAARLDVDRIEELVRSLEARKSQPTQATR